MERKETYMLQSTRRLMLRLAISAGVALAVPLAAHAEATAPDALVQRLSTEVIDAVRSDATIQGGDVKKIMALVDAKILPHVNFNRMTASAVGRYWRQATPEQQKRLQEEFKTLLVRTYSGALAQVRDQTVQLKPMRSKPDDAEVVVRTEIRG
jgi:phospholipid transport system substrate-binding protein